jgi:hypothetical protein
MVGMTVLPVDDGLEVLTSSRRTAFREFDVGWKWLCAARVRVDPGALEGLVTA